MKIIIDEFTDRDDLSYWQKHYQRNKETLTAKTGRYVRERKYKDPQGYLCTRIRNRAKEKNLEFNLEPSDFVIPEICPITNLRLFFSDKTTEHTPTVDRIDNAKGYIKGNVAIISWRANKAKSDLSLDEIKALANYISKTH